MSPSATPRLAHSKWAPCWRATCIGSLLILAVVHTGTQSVLLQQRSLLVQQQGCKTANEKPLYHPQFRTAFSTDAEPVEIEPDFDWSRVNLDQKGICGMKKCFFDATTNDSTRTTEWGYLVANHTKYDAMRKSSYVANWMTSKMGAKHFFTDEPPVLVRVTPQRVQQLNELVHQPQRVMSNVSLHKIYGANDTAVAIQKVKKAPMPYINFGKGRTKMKSLQAALPSFCRQVPDRDAMAAQLAREREVIWKTLLMLPVPWTDTQGVVDVHGNFYFIDIDGVNGRLADKPETFRMNQIISCMESFDLFVQLLLECIDEERGIQ